MSEQLVLGKHTVVSFMLRGLTILALYKCIITIYIECVNCCRLDGYCRHVLATLYEVIDYRTDSKTSVTSESCRWVRRATESSNGVLLTDIQTDLVQRPANDT